MRLRALVFLAAVIGAGVSAPAITAQTTESKPEQVIDRLQSAAQQLSFSGTFVHQQGPVLQTSRILQLRDAKRSGVKVQALEGSRHEIIRTAQEIRVYMPEHRMVKRDRTDLARSAFPAIFVGTADGILRNYELVRGGSIRMADLEADEYLLKPRHDLRWPVRFWVDQQSGLVLKCQRLDFDGQAIEQAAFTELRFDPKVRASALRPSFQSAKDWTVHDASMSRLQPMPALRYKPEVVKGFELIGVYQQPATGSEGGLPFAVRRYVLSDGIATLSVFVQPRQANGAVAERVYRRGALSMISREVQEAWVTVMGEVPPETLRQFAQSIEWKVSP
ncbi:MAG: sigma factor regulatory protein [Pseudomonadota bacterium]|jgi:sigma-E factor negative regulatory protein RseB